MVKNGRCNPPIRAIHALVDDLSSRLEKICVESETPSLNEQSTSRRSRKISTKSQVRKVQKTAEQIKNAGHVFK